MQVLTKTQPSHNVDKPMFNAAGVLLQFLASPEEVGDAICLIRSTMPGDTQHSFDNQMTTLCIPHHDQQVQLSVGIIGAKKSG